ncbi:type I restriction enzyme S subunit [Malaciobacter marinus]|jgi:type I restriction enzyme S subunit|uniref:Type I restriction enzyme S subunit n=1 Tax=Malaciobacter marinus TaxID=505249 RepID=A0AB36ZUM1_9BACT|nr:restriction endonuclease subunit S [Malaciobacter marinus]PPK60506.1 type I restriction enzyme S subunit [Malaciobacter marinus]
MSELYDLPNGWEWKTLSDVFSIERGGSPRPIKDYITEDEDGINWIKIGDTVKGGRYITSTAQKIKPSGLKKSRLVIEGDFIMSNSMSFGRPYIVKTKGAIHDGWLLMREKLEDMDKDYFYYLLSSNYMYQQFTSKASGTTVKNLNINLVKSTNIPMPPLDEQQRIVSKLDNLFEKIDKAIELHQKNIYEANVFMESVLNDMFGELEEKYSKIKFDEVCNKITDGSHNPPKGIETSEFLMLSSKNIFNNSINFDNPRYLKEEDFIKENKRTDINKGDVLLTIVGTIGRTAVVNLERKFVLQRSVAVLKPKKNLLDSYFLMYSLQKNLDILMSGAKGAAQKGIYLKSIKNLEIVNLPLNIQQEVVKYLNEVSKKIEKVKSIQKEKMENLKALKASILDKAFKGKL